MPQNCQHDCGGDGDVCAETPVAFGHAMAEPTITIQGAPPAPAEAAAIAAAIERFEADTAPARQPAQRRRDPWLHAGLLEGTGNDPDNPFQSLANL